MEKKAEARQIRMIHAIGRALGISEGRRDDDLHALVAGVSGKASIGDLNAREAAQVIKALRARQGPYSPSKEVKRERKVKAASQETQVPGGITPGQKRKCWALMYELEKRTGPGEAGVGQRLCGVIEKELKVTVNVKDPFRWLDYKSGNKLIEVLKGYVASAARRKEAG